MVHAATEMVIKKQHFPASCSQPARNILGRPSCHDKPASPSISTAGSTEHLDQFLKLIIIWSK